MQACKKRKRKRKIGKERGFNILPFHHPLERCQVGCHDFSLGGAIFHWSPCVRHWRVYIEELKYRRGRVLYRSLPSSVGAISWSLESCWLRPVVRGPKPCPSGRRNVSFPLRSCLDGLPLQRSIIHARSYCLWDIVLCHTYWQTSPWVVNMTGPASWLEGRFYMQLGLGICPGEPHQQLGWVSGNSACSSVFKTLPSIFSGIPVFHFLAGGCQWWHICGWKNPVSWKKGLHDTFAQRVDVLVNHWLVFLHMLGAAQTSDSCKGHPVSNICFEGIWGVILCQFKKAGKHLSGDWALLPGNVLFFFLCKDYPCAHVVGRLDMYRTKVLMYHTMVLMARLTKVRR